jgi:hypothetical protein
VDNVTPEMIAKLQREQARLSERIECLTRNRDAIADSFPNPLHLLDGEWGFAAGVGASLKAHQSGSADEGAGEEAV